MSHFHIGNGVARINLKRPLLDYATEVCVSPGTDLKQLPLRKAQKLLRYVSLVEHEYFHCRSMLVTTFGWVLFQIYQVMKTLKIELLEALPQHPDNTSKQGAPSAEQAEFHLRLSLALQSFLNRPAGDVWKILEPLGREEGDAFGEHLGRWHPCLSEIARPSDTDLQHSDQLPNVHDIFEAYAVWKEYAYACIFAVRGDPERFHDLTEPIILPSLEAESYRRAGDLLANTSGLSYRFALPGILFDIALSPPLQAGKQTSWDEFHPTLRLRRMASALPTMVLPTWARSLNFEPVPDDAYDVMDDLFATRFGWRHARYNKATLLEVLLRQREHDVEELASFASAGPKSIPAAFRSVREFWTIVALEGKLRNPMIFIQPRENSREVARLGYFTQPMITVFDDEMVVNRSVLPNNYFTDLYIVDAIIARYLDFVINSNEFSPPRFIEPRHMYRLAKRLAKKRRMQVLQGILPKDFDAFIAKQGLLLKPGSKFDLGGRLR